MKNLFFSFFFPCTLFLFTCSDIIAQCGLADPVYFGPLNEYSEDFHVKVYFTFLNHPTGTIVTQSQADASALVSLNNLNAAFNVHGVFFQRGTNTCTGSLSSVVSVSSGTSIDALIQTDPSVLHSDGIDVFIYDLSGPGNGNAYRVPHKYLWVSGNYDGVWANQTTTLIHEVGHTIGLLHIGIDVCDVYSNQCSNTQYCTGDFISDTPSNLPISNTFDCATEIWAKNFMAYTTVTCRNSFTPEQVTRMRYHLKNHPALSGVKIQPIVFSASGTVNSTGPSPSIVIEAGVTVEVTQPLEMLPGTSIRIKKGGRLNVKSTITGACNQMWQGVIVEGSNLLSQTPSNQGWVYLYSTGKIEHAKVGIDVGAVNHAGIQIPNTGGGLVNISLGKIENCITGVRFHPYVWLAQVKAIANASKILFPDIKITDAYRAGPLTPTHFELKGIVQLGITKGSLDDQRTTCSSVRATGISSLNSSFKINGTLFENLQTGAIVNQLIIDPGAFSFSGCKFERCFTGIHSLMNPGFSITGCTFELGRPNFCAPSSSKIFGVNLEGNSENFTYSTNDFINIAVAEVPETLIGDLCTSLGIANNKVFLNSYLDLNIGSQVKGENFAMIGLDPFGLRYLCNQYTTNFAFTLPDIAIHGSPGSTVFNPQANFDNVQISYTLPAGNAFFTSEKFINQGGLIDYYFDANPALNQDPVGTSIVSNITKIPVNDSDGNYCSGGGSAPCDPCSRAEIDQIETEFFSVKQNLSTPPTPAQQVELETLGTTVLQYFYRDTTEVSVDSILYWLNEVNTYASQLRLATHLFFSGQETAFQTKWSALKLLYSEALSTSDEISHLDQVFEVLQGKNWNGGLSAAELTQMETFLPNCDLSAFTSKAILLTHQIHGEVSCDLLRTAASDYNNRSKSSLLQTSPNPVEQHFRLIGLPTETTCANIRVFDVHGRLAFEYNEYQAGSEVNIAHLSEGLYFCQVLTADRVIGSTIVVKK